MNRRFQKILLPAAALVAVAESSASACAACYGQSDSPLAQGMNWGIMSLLAVVACVFAGFIAFFVHVARNSAKMPALQPEQLSTDKLQ